MLTRLYSFPARYCRLLAPTPDSMCVIKRGYIPLTPMPIVGCAAMEQTDEDSDGCRRFTVKITCTLRQRPTAPTEPQAFLALTHDGRRLVIGTDSAPYPLQTITDTHSASAADRTSCTLTITLTGAQPALEVI